MKNIITLGLSIFLFISIVYLVITEINNKQTLNENTTQQQSHLGIYSNNPSLSNQKSQIPTDSNRVIVYYFHGIARCPTCRVIEQQTKEAVEEAFTSELESGRVEFRSINVEDPTNEHYIEDFQLSTRCVVVEWTINGKTQDWKRLEKVWELVHGEKGKYYRYIQDNVQEYLKKVIT